MSAVEAATLTLYYLVLGVLTVYSVHRFYLVRLRRRSAEPRRVKGTAFPPLTIQLPVYNEPNVVERLLDAVTAIEYPGALEIQVLDDSTDATSALIVAWNNARNDARIRHIRRANRDGFKAGALAHGMSLSDSELFAVFDADFVPPPDILLRLVPYFAGARVGMVQARWTHLNRDESLLTRVQALFLDAHFAVESAARSFGGRFFNFNGTAGIWRRTAIEDAGGWSSSTLTEDLDLSYRAQLAGWEFVFCPDVEVPAELPAALSGFQDQQHRWAKGSIQTARKLLGTILRSDFAAPVKAEALFHLTMNAAYLLSLLLSLLIVPAMLIRYRHGLLWSFFIDLLLFAMSSGSVLLFYREGQRWAGRPRPRARELFAVLPVGVGMSVRNAFAVIEGAFESGGYFKRTPKRGVGGGAGPPVRGGRPPSFVGGGGAPAPPRRGGPPPHPKSRFPILELVLTVFFASTVVAFAEASRWASLPFLTLFVTGYGYIAILALTEAITGT